MTPSPRLFCVLHFYDNMGIHGWQDNPSHFLHHKALYFGMNGRETVMKYLGTVWLNDFFTLCQCAHFVPRKNARERVCHECEVEGNREEFRLSQRKCLYGSRVWLSFQGEVVFGFA